MINHHNIAAVKKFYKNLFDEVCEDTGWFLNFFLSRTNKEVFLNSYCNDIHPDLHIAFGETKLVLWEDSLPYVIKIPFNYFDPNNPNYCEIELINYRNVVKNSKKLADCFAWCDYLFDYLDVPIYIMEKAIVNEEEIESRAYDSAFNYSLNHSGIHNDDSPEYIEFCEKFSKSYYEMTYSDQMQCLLDEEWGAELGLAFDDYCQENEINDRHPGNFGYVDNHLVIIDYSGFFGDF